ncbi:unnamed protein product [Rotaria sordida]|uniref:RING-type domain-containing protein n=1 Tax=Rotaria sordida TaxID=392033 RepID=A0A815GZ02_9BILA|nr:unnamed protein product [Rotaria sordida]CAF1598760.1 unnamed protein product [Rotaria sordida]
MVDINARNKHMLDRKYICPVCSLILREPVQLTECGDRLCQTCLNAEQETTIKCRQCQAEISRIEYQQAIFKLIRQISSQFNDRQMNINLPRTTTTGACIPATAQFEEVHEMLNIFAGGIEALVNNEQRLSNESFQMQITLTILKEESSKLK